MEYSWCQWSLLSHICALTNLVERDPSPLHCVRSCSVLIFWVWIWYRQKGLSAVCASVPGRFECRVHLLCWIYWWITLSHCYNVMIINTTVGRINTAQGIGACSRAFRHVTACLYMEPMFSLSVLSLLETFNVYEWFVWTMTCTF